MTRPAPGPGPGPGSNPILPIDVGGVTAILAVVALIVVLGVRPITRLQQAQAARDDSLGLLEAQIAEIDAQIESLRDRLEQTVAQIDQRQLKLLTPSDLNARIAGIIERASAHGLEVLAIKPGELTDGEHHGRTPIDIELAGPLPDLVRYLHAMRSESADLIIQRIEIEASAEGGGEGGGGGGGITAQIRTDWLTTPE